MGEEADQLCQDIDVITSPLPSEPDARLAAIRRRNALDKRFIEAGGTVDRYEDVSFLLWLLDGVSVLSRACAALDALRPLRASQK